MTIKNPARSPQVLFEALLFRRLTANRVIVKDHTIVPDNPAPATSLGYGAYS
jgi:hypothetical protein